MHAERLTLSWAGQLGKNMSKEVPVLHVLLGDVPAMLCRRTWRPMVC